MANPHSSHYLDIGDLGEDLVAQWLQSTGWIILHRRFSCRWGEIDIIAQYPNNFDTSTKNCILAFVEVKTRSPKNWDAGGRSAVTLQKQAKIWQTAEIFLAKYPEKADYSCRFDVAIVGCQEISKVTVNEEVLATSSASGYVFKLQEYIPGAFDS